MSVRVDVGDAEYSFQAMAMGAVVLDDMQALPELLETLLCAGLGEQLMSEGQAGVPSGIAKTAPLMGAVNGEVALGDNLCFFRAEVEFERPIAG